MKLKCLFLTVAALFFLFNGCNKDTFFDDESNLEFFDDESNPELKKANVPIPLKGEVCMIENEIDRMPVYGPNGQPLPNVALAKTALLYGNLTHLGKLDERSSMIGQDGAHLDLQAFSQGKIVIIAVYDVRLFAANGDYIDGFSNIRIDKSAQNFSADFTITSGSGNFENVTGSGLLSGEIHRWDVEGTLEFPRD